MSRPTTLPTWATDENYPPGALPHSGQPTKINPTSGQRAQGMEPKIGFGAQQFNAMFANHGDWIAYLDAVRLSAIFGVRGNGDADLDGVTTVFGMTLAGSTYTMDRDAYWDNVTLSTGVTLKTNGYRLFVTDALTIASGALVHNSGGNASGRTGGTAGASGSLLGGQAGGLGGEAGATENGANGAQRTVSLGGGGGAGAAGAGSGSNGTGGTGGSTVAPAAEMGGLYDLAPLTTGHLYGLNTAKTAVEVYVLAGGGGGGGGGSAIDGGGQSDGGGGGGSAGIVLICARQIENEGAIRANGGNGGNAAISGGVGAPAGGGGGGGGGLVRLIYAEKTGAGAVTAGGGTGGTSAVGPGPSGTNGSGGTVELIDLSAVA